MHDENGHVVERARCHLEVVPFGWLMNPAQEARAAAAATT